MIFSLSNRKSYSCLKKYTYFNQASLGLISDASTRKMTNFLNKVAKFGNIHISDEDELNLVAKLRKNASKLLGGQHNQTAVLSSASELLSQIPHILKPPQKSEILMIKTIINNINPKTKVIALSLVQYSTGTKIDLGIISKKVQNKGIKLVIDITQALGAIPIFAEKWKADFLVSSGYKWLGGHGGVSLAYINRDLLKTEPLNAGWMGAPKPFKMIADQCKYYNNAKSYTQSTMSYVSIIGIEESIKEIIKLNPNKIEDHSKKLSKYLRNEMNKSKWNIYNNENSSNKSFHIISFQPKSKKIEPVKIFKKLNKRGIICSLRNNRLRLSIAHYNNQNDINHLLETLN